MVGHLFIWHMCDDETKIFLHFLSFSKERKVDERKKERKRAKPRSSFSLSREKARKRRPRYYTVFAIRVSYGRRSKKSWSGLSRDITTATENVSDIAWKKCLWSESRCFLSYVNPTDLKFFFKVFFTCGWQPTDRPTNESWEKFFFSCRDNYDVTTTGFP